MKRQDLSIIVMGVLTVVLMVSSLLIPNHGDREDGSIMSESESELVKEEDIPYLFEEGKVSLE
ncbi:hypothetical protein [Shouchella shacheensis]|uniref:hypothetical protein n=1 Tax=Shouchella shacheensis TaxID=1649580 RepID=UPI00074031A6|nr:hypothetical protein [Shouchella shacheensis]